MKKKVDASELFETLNPKGEFFREVVFEIIPMISERIHVKGLAADGSAIGTYSDGYMKIRTGEVNHRHDATNLKTKKTFSTKPKYNRSADPKVIISLTRQLENDYAVLPGDKGWGVGFNNVHNFEKATWNNTRYGKTIYDLTDAEEARVAEIVEELANLMN
jgi:hypothetical protein